MFLKKLEIQGFKSFPDKISLEFNRGVTSVVGPNGSGKSNIADAIRWVLGEQSIKTLRGSRMEDVIFSGTENRKPVGFAEVSITIDNADGTLPLEFNEVTITRRLFRSGESEYYINKVLCRLKDIVELFFDTGVGRDGYSVIGQGRIDEILSARSEDRRNIFEEASGIMKYKVRRLEAERKLESTGQNLLRINDIIIELENQLEPLGQQADTARKYLALKEKLKELDVNVFIENITKLKEKIGELEEQYLSLKEDMDAENEKLEKITCSNREKSERLKLLEEKMEISRQEYYNLEAKLEREASDIKINEERLKSINKDIARLDGEIAEIGKRIDDLLAEEALKHDKLKYLNEKYAEYATRLAEFEEQYKSIVDSLSEKEQHIEKLKALVMDKLDILSDKKTQINNVKAHRDNLFKRKKAIEQEIYSLSLEKDRELLKKEDVAENLRSIKTNIEQKQGILKELNAKKSQLAETLSELRKKQNGIKTEIQYKLSRHKALKEMEENLEGYGRSVRSILKACSQSEQFGRGIYGALAQLIEVEPKYETAVEMALAGALQHIVTSSEEDAQRAIDFLKKNKLGRATFLPISSIKGKSLDLSVLETVRRKDGFCGIASDLVHCRDELKGIITSLLGRVVVVETLDAAIEIARSFSYGFKIVTLQGDVLSQSGSITGGSVEHREISILSRHREISELDDSIKKMRLSEQLLEKEISQNIEEINALEQETKEYEGKVKEHELEKVREESRLVQVNENVERTAARIEMLKQESEQLLRREKETEEELKKYIEEQLQIEKEIADARSTIAEYQEKSKENQAMRDTLQTDITNYKISVNSILESIESVKETIGKIDGQKTDIRKSIAKRQNEKNKNLEEIKKLSKINEGLLAEIKRSEEEKSGKTFEIDRISEEKKVLEDELSDLVNQISDTNKNILLLSEELNRISVRKAKLESDLESIQNRMWDEYALTYTNALPLKKDIGSISQAQKIISEIREEINGLGHVNVAAIDEYVKVKERYEFMKAQRDDMEKAKEKLKRVIYEMTSIMKKQFIEQFKLINENFNTVFRELFNGGKAELILLDEENVLESGIEIEVQPPGKKTQNMMLLSGGERALTAIALLFAILKLKPTPFCVLDEIESSLDDANVYRFSQYLKRYADSTQFILITHRKGTMEESDTLYGVTMQEYGISKIISLKMGQKVG